VIAVRRAEPQDAGDLVRLAAAVGREPGEWLLTTETWRSVADERRYLKAVRRHTHAAVFVARAVATACSRLASTPPEASITRMAPSVAAKPSTTSAMKSG